MCIRDRPSAVPSDGWTRPQLALVRRRIHLMASVRCADLARRHGQCGAHRFWRPYRGGEFGMMVHAQPMAVPPGCHTANEVRCSQQCDDIFTDGRSGDQGLR
eukprot:13170457-Alexandrium_andersonii.AAC.1